MEAFKTDFIDEAWESISQTIGTLSHHEMKTLGFINEHLPPWQQSKMIDSPYRTTDTLTKIKTGFMLGLEQYKIAQIIGISSKTLTRRKQKSQELCLLIDKWTQYIEVLAKMSFLKLLHKGNPDVVMFALKKTDQRYTNNYQKKCPTCRTKFIRDDETVKSMRDLFDQLNTEQEK